MYCQIVSIEGTVKEMYYTVRELFISDLPDPLVAHSWAFDAWRVIIA